MIVETEQMKVNSVTPITRPAAQMSSAVRTSNVSEIHTNVMGKMTVGMVRMKSDVVSITQRLNSYLGYLLLLKDIYIYVTQLC